VPGAARVPVTTIVSFSVSIVPVDWAKAAVGKRTAVEQSKISFFTLNPDELDDLLKDYKRR
jgi:hypothetical protein